MLAKAEEIITDVSRQYLPSQLVINSWKDIEGFFKELLKRNLSSAIDLKKWLIDRSELEAVLEEDLGWRYIKRSCDTTNEEYANAFILFVNEIQPLISPQSHALDLKLLSSPFLSNLNDARIDIVVRQIKMRVEIFREENVPLIAEVQTKEQEYAAINGAMTVEVDGKELTLQQASNFLERDDRTKREEVYRKILKRRLQDRERLDDLFNELLKLRNKIALNAGFKNFRDYMFASLGRFDYTAEDCFKFHDAVSREVVPLVNYIEKNHKKSIGIDALRPWDLSAEPIGQTPLHPSNDATDLMRKTITCFSKLDPFLGDCMQAMQDAKRLDLDSRIGKAPGGYNYPLYETGLPFIFMNSTNSLRDLVTIVHEGGHAVHSIVTKELDLVDYKNLPSEVAELASMSMELLSMEQWADFFPNPKDLARARKKQLQDVLKGLPWIAAVDAFQHWIYLNPEHTSDERRQAWKETYMRFSGNEVDWSGLEDAKENLWQKQLHIFEVPFYYIEYGFAQLGAIAVWRNFHIDKQKSLQQYLAALRLGYTCSIGDIYKTAGINFEFSASYVKELCDFVKVELEKVS